QVIRKVSGAGVAAAVDGDDRPTSTVVVQDLLRERLDLVFLQRSPSSHALSIFRPRGARGGRTCTLWRETVGHGGRRDSRREGVSPATVYLELIREHRPRRERVVPARGQGPAVATPG